MGTHLSGYARFRAAAAWLRSFTVHKLGHVNRSASMDADTSGYAKSRASASEFYGRVPGTHLHAPGPYRRCSSNYNRNPGSTLIKPLRFKEFWGATSRVQGQFNGRGTSWAKHPLDLQKCISKPKHNRFSMVSDQFGIGFDSFAHDYIAFDSFSPLKL